MLRLHDFECTVCDITVEELIDVPPSMANLHCPKCRGDMRHVVVGGRAHVFKPFWHPHLDHKPVHIGSWSQYREELKKRGYSNVLAT